MLKLHAVAGVLDSQLGLFKTLDAQLLCGPVKSVVAIFLVDLICVKAD